MNEKEKKWKLENRMQFIGEEITFTDINLFIWLYMIFPQ